MGLELDLRRESEADLAVLRAGIALHKQHRELIHSGRFLRLDSSAETSFIGCVSPDGSEGLFSYAKLDVENSTLPSRIRFAGLAPERRYRLRMVWPQTNRSQP